MITDSTGREYIDGLAGLWNVNVGHGRQELADAAQKQMATLAFHSAYAGGTNEPAIRLAERLSGLTYPSINTFFFTSGGAESSESSFKTARFYWKALGKPDKIKVISRHRAYHGLTLAAMSATGLPAFWPMFEPRTPGFLHIDAPDPVPLRQHRSERQPRRRRRQQAGGSHPPRRPRYRRRLHRRTGAGRRRGHRPARRLLPSHPRDLHEVRRAADRRRCDHRLRQDRTLVRPRTLRHRAGHHAVRQGHHQRLHPARRHRGVGHDPRRDQRRARGQAVDARVHLLRPSDLLRRGAGEHRHPGARAAGGARGRAAARGCSRGCGRWSRWTAWATSAGRV